MSIPPLLSRSPPPICEISDEDEETFEAYVGSELACDVFPGADILEDYEKKIVSSSRCCEDTTSDDSGLCMGSVGQNQSPCDTSPVSSAYTQTGNGDNEHNCKSKFSFPTLDPEEFEAKFNKSFTSAEEDLDSSSNETLTSERKDSDISFKNLEDNFFFDSSNIMTKVEASKTFNDIQPTETCSSFEVDEKIENGEDTIPIQEFNADVCDYNSFIAENSRLGSENIEFNHFEGTENKNDLPDAEENDLTLESVSTNVNEIDSKSYVRLEGDSDIPMKFSDSCYSLPNGISIFLENNDMKDLMAKDLKIDKTEGEVESTLELAVDTYSDTSERTISTVNVLDTNCSAQSHFVSNSISIDNRVESMVDDEDDFSDFAEFQSNVDPTLDDIVSATPPNFDQELWIDWWPECQIPPSMSLHLNEELKGNKIWTQLQQLERSPALLYQWSSSVSNCKLLSALNIDSRNILLGPWNRYKFSVTEGFSSNGMKKKNMEDSDLASDNVIFKDPVPDAHFDWVGSGLVNPLDSPCDSRRENECKERVYSSQINEILQALPDLAYMRKSFIVFPRCTT